jgi:midasin (ATPase involved in ribosome maturation)
MFNFNEYPNIVKAHKQYTKLEKEKDVAIKKLENAVILADCPNCDKYSHTMLTQDFLSCGSCIKAQDLIKLQQEAKDAKTKWENYVHAEYSLIVYDAFSTKKPILLRKVDHQTIKWDIAFGNEKKLIKEKDRESLVHLIEGESGEYEFYENW